MVRVTTSDGFLRPAPFSIMKYIFAVLTLLALLLIASLGQASPTSAPRAENVGQSESGNLVFIQSQPNDLEGWVDIAPLGSTARTNDRSGNVEGLIHLPFSASGDTKIIVNMDYAEWIFTTGITTQVTQLGNRGSAQIMPTEPRILMLSAMKTDSLAEVYLSDSPTMVPMDGPDQYAINAHMLRWAKIPLDAHVSLLK